MWTKGNDRWCLCLAKRGNQLVCRFGLFWKSIKRPSELSLENKTNISVACERFTESSQ